MNQPLIWYVPGYYELSFFEIVLTAFLFLFVLIKKDKLVMIVIGAKIIIHELVAANIFWTAFPIFKATLPLFFPTILKQILYIIMLIWMIHCEKRGNYKRVCIGIVSIFCIELFSAFIYYPQYMDYFYNGCLECNKTMSKRTSLWMTTIITSAPFTQIKNRLLVTIAEVIAFLMQILFHRKDEKA